MIATQDHPAPYLAQRQDKLSPVPTSTNVPGLGVLHGWLWPNGVRQFFGVPYAQFAKNWSRSTLVTSWPNNEHDGKRLGFVPSPPLIAVQGFHG